MLKEIFKKEGDTETPLERENMKMEKAMYQILLFLISQVIIAWTFSSFRKI